MLHNGVFSVPLALTWRPTAHPDDRAGGVTRGGRSRGEGMGRRGSGGELPARGDWDRPRAVRCRRHGQRRGRRRWRGDEPAVAGSRPGVRVRLEAVV